MKTLFTLRAKALLVVTGISAYDTEAANRYARESLEEVRDDIVGRNLDLGFADGDERDAKLSLPADIEPNATLEDGVEGDPEGTMEQADFSVDVPVFILFSVEAPHDTPVDKIVEQAIALLSAATASRAVIAFDDECMGGELRLTNPLSVSLVA